jgi:type I restriction-modification system DNA methylase subunit
VAKTRKTIANGTGANLGFEAKLWAAADALRNNMDAAEYKHVVLGLIFLKYISDAFEAKHAELEAEKKKAPIQRIRTVHRRAQDGHAHRSRAPRADRRGRREDRRAYHAWRGDKGAAAYADVAGFCRSAKLDDIRKHGHVLTPGRYVGAEEIEDDGEPFEEKMKRLSATLRQQQEEGGRLDAAIAANLKALGYGD